MIDSTDLCLEQRDRMFPNGPITNSWMEWLMMWEIETRLYLAITRKGGVR